MRLHFMQTFNPISALAVISVLFKGPLLVISVYMSILGTAAGQCPITVDAGPDQFVCNPPAQVQLDGSITGTYLNFLWTPTTNMSNANTLSPTINANQTIQYILRARAANPGLNAIDNGDFEQGNTGFSSDYLYNPGFTMFPFGSYEVTNTPASFPDCPDHTSGSGMYLVVDGAQTANLQVWCQTVAVTPNTDYALSAWALSFVTNAPYALLEFTINGTAIGSPLSVPPPQCQWRPFSAIWNSGSNTSATICIENLTVTGSNNDFGIDDIELNPICAQSDTVKVQIVNVVAAANPFFFTLPCAGVNISLNATGSTLGSNISYLWETSDGNIVSGANTMNPVIDQPGTYTLTVSYDYGAGQCTKTRDVTVILSPNALNATIQPPQPLGCGGTTVNLVGQSNQGSVGYSWSTTNGNIIVGANSATAMANQPGIYTLTITNSINGCSATAQTTVLVANNPPVANAVASGPISCLVPQSNLSGQGSSAGGNIQYSWSSPNGIIGSGQNSINAIAASNGLYILKVLNASNTCFTLDSVLVVSDTVLPTITLLPPSILNCISDTVAIKVNVTPANATLLWTAGPGGSIASGANATQVSVLTAATYQLLVTDPSNACTQSLSVNILKDTLAPIAVVANADTLSCQQTSVQLNGTGSSTGPNIAYFWSSFNGGNVVSGEQTLNPIVNAAGLYQLLVTNTQNGCTDTATVQVRADANVIIAIATAEDTLDCKTATVGLNAIGSSNVPGLLYAWSVASGSSGNFTSAVNGPIATVDAAGIYQLVLTNPASGCTAVDLAVVYIDTIKPVVQIALPDTITCVQPNLNLMAVNADSIGVFTYSWSTTGGNIVSGNNTLMLLVNAAGPYILLTTNALSGCSAMDTTVVILATGAPNAQINAPDTLDCALQSFALSSVGSSMGTEYQYAWTASNGGNIVQGIDQPNPLIDAPGRYKLQITNLTNGCSAVDSITVVKDTLAPPALAGADTVLLTCLQTSVLLTANLGLMVNVQYDWTTNGGNILGNPNLSQISVDSAGEYFLKVTDPANACLSSDTILIGVDQQAPDLAVLPPAILSCKLPIVPLQANSTIVLLDFQWQTTDGTLSGVVNTANANAAAPGTYQVVARNPANGCTSLASVIVSLDTVPPVAATADTVTLTCFVPILDLVGFTNISTGLFGWTTASGNILSGANTTVAKVDKGGIYVFTVIDSINGCTASDSIVIVQNTTKPTVSAGVDVRLNCNVQTLGLQGMIGLNGGASYQWLVLIPGNIIGDPKSLLIQVDEPGVYVLEVRDTVNGCEAFDTVRVFIDTLSPVAQIGNPQLLTCARESFNLISIGSNLSGATFTWTALNGGNIVTGNNTSSPLIDAPGTYQLVVAYPANGCTAIDSVVVLQNITSPPVSINLPAPLSCMDTTRTLVGSPSFNGFQYAWTTANGNIVGVAQNSSVLVDQIGDYQLLVTSIQTGCADSAVVSLGLDTIPPVLSLSTPDTLTCAVTTVNLAAIATPGTGNTVQWTTQNGNLVGTQTSLSAMADQPGQYMIAVTRQQNGCVARDTVVVFQNITPPVARVGLPFTLNCTVPSGDLNGTTSTGAGTLGYAWSTLNGLFLGDSTSAVALIGSAGIYTLQVRDAANGCTDTAQVQILQDTQIPLVQILPALPFTCLRDSALLNAAGSSTGPDYVSNWTDINGVNLMQQQGLISTVFDTGLYVLVIVNQINGCSSNDTIQVVSDNAPPDANAGPPALLYCTQPKVALKGSSTTGPDMLYQWSTLTGVFESGENTANPVVVAGGIYVVTVTNPNNGCTNVDNTSVALLDLPVFTLNVIQPTCLDPKSIIAFEDVKGGVGPYTFAIDGGVIFKTNEIYDKLAPATYYPVVRDQFGCTSFQTVIIEAPVLPEVDLIQFTLIELGTNYTIIPTTIPGPDSILQWQWSPAEHLSCTDCPSPTATPIETAYYTLTVTDLAGCTASDEIQVRVNPSRYVYFPNIISPNGDGENDRFTLFGRNVDEIELLQIFNRWGAMVYEKKGLLFNDELDGWDGKVKGEPPLPGVYVWQARIRYSDGVIDWFKGDVTVIR